MPRHESKTTKDHEIIREWAEQRDGYPAIVKGTEADETALIRIDFDDGTEDDQLERVSWETFFDTFDRKDLTFLYQEETKDGDPSRFFKIIHDEE